MDEFEDMPFWKKVFIAVFVVLMPFIGSLDSIAW